MKNLLFVVLLFCGLVNAEESAKNKEALINELIEITNALSFVEVMNQALTDGIMQGMGLPEDLSVSIADEVRKVMNEELIENGLIRGIMQTLYSKYYTDEELRQVVAFYKTDVGKKTISVLPNITQESAEMTQQHFVKVIPKIQSRIAWLYGNRQSKVMKR